MDSIKKRKNYLLLFFLASIFLFVCPLSAEEGKELWKNDFSAARKEALAAQKLLLLFFTVSDHAPGGSRNLLQSFRFNKKFLTQAKKDYILMQIDLPQNKYALPRTRRRHNEHLQSRFGILHFPAIICIDPRSPWGTLLYKRSGMIRPPQLLALLEKHIPNHLKRVRDARKKALKQEK